MRAKRAKATSDIEVLSSVQDLLKPKRAKVIGKSPRTLMLDHTAFERFQDACRERGARPSALIDRWIAAFLESIVRSGD